MQEVITAISTVGFPIVMTLLLLYLYREQDKNHKEEMEKVTNALNNNTLVVSQLKELLEIKLDDKEEK